MPLKSHRLHCQEPWFTLLRTGKKPVEGRKNSPAYQAIRQGDQIEFYCDQQQFHASVLSIKRYDSLRDYLQGVGIENASPGVSSLEEAQSVYLQWSTQEEIQRWGFLAIFIKKASGKFHRRNYSSKSARSHFPDTL